MNKKMITRVLEKPGFKSRRWTTAFKVQAMAPWDYAAVLMECHMPKMAGLEATAAISAAESRTDRHVPVIALTASALEADRDRCLAMGMADLLTQPIGRAELAAMQDRWIPLRVEATRTS